MTGRPASWTSRVQFATEHFYTATITTPENRLELLGNRIKLRPLNGSDIGDLYDAWNDPGFYGEYAGYDPKSRAEIEQMAKDERLFVISSRPGDRTIGFIQYYRVRQDYLHLFEVGYRIRPGERGKGYTTEAARILVEHLFTTDKDIERIEAVVDTENVPSQRVLEKNGFKREGELKKRFFIKGQYRDEYMYRLLREEWEEREPWTRPAAST